MTTDRVFYYVNEVFRSLQGEGSRAGSLNVFVRFAGCNLACSRDNEAGFDCDTEFASGRRFLLPGIVDAIIAAWDGAPGRPHVIFTGGEPALQLDAALLDALHNIEAFVAIETNGTHALPAGLDWVVVSPHTAEHTLKVTRADELRYVRHAGQGVPKPTIEAPLRYVSPAFLPDGAVDPAALRTCIAIVEASPSWRLSVQQHKAWRVR